MVARARPELEAKLLDRGSCVFGELRELLGPLDRREPPVAELGKPRARSGSLASYGRWRPHERHREAEQILGAYRVAGKRVVSENRLAILLVKIVKPAGFTDVAVGEQDAEASVRMVKNTEYTGSSLASPP